MGREELGFAFSNFKLARELLTNRKLEHMQPENCSHLFYSDKKGCDKFHGAAKQGLKDLIMHTVIPVMAVGLGIPNIF